jgi:hypothetical protein
VDVLRNMTMIASISASELALLLSSEYRDTVLVLDVRDEVRECRLYVVRHSGQADTTNALFASLRGRACPCGGRYSFHCLGNVCERRREDFGLRVCSRTLKLRQQHVALLLR